MYDTITVGYKVFFRDYRFFIESTMARKGDRDRIRTTTTFMCVFVCMAI